MVTATKRFIAGAVCPRCGAMDRIRMFSEDERRFRECVSCGFRDEIRIDAPPREPDTRVNRSPEERAKEVQPVRLIDPGKKSR